jgi:hypothetical protein
MYTSSIAACNVATLFHQMCNFIPKLGHATLHDVSVKSIPSVSSIHLSTPFWIKFFAHRLIMNACHDNCCAVAISMHLFSSTQWQRVETDKAIV